MPISTDSKAALRSVMALVKAHVATNANTRRKGCKFCNCFLSIKHEDSTSFHVRHSPDNIEFVTVYHGKTYCAACHRWQVEE